MASNRLALLTLAVLAGCGGERGSSEAANDLSRDLQRVPVDSSATLGDRASSSGATVCRRGSLRRGPSRSPSPRPLPSPSPRRPAPAPRRWFMRWPPVPRCLPRSTARSRRRLTRSGQTVTSTVSADVRDASGEVVIPAGSRVTLTIAEIHESENKGDKTGKLTLTPSSVEIGGTSYALEASADGARSYAARPEDQRG